MTVGCKGVGKRNGGRLFFKVGGAVACVLCMLLSTSAVTASGGANWTMQRVAQNPTIVSGFSSALDNNGNPGIAYASTAGIMFTYPESGTWKCETVDSGVHGGGIDLTWDGNTWIMAYGDSSRFENHGLLKFAKRDPTTGAWSIQTVEPDNIFMRTKGIAAYNANGKYLIGISYRNNNGLRYAEYNGNTWTKTTIEKNAVAAYNAVDFDSTGQPAIAYGNQDKAGNHLKYAKRSSGTWSLSNIAAGSDKYGLGVDLEISSNDCPYVLDRTGLYYNVGNGWVHEQVASSLYLLSLALDETSGTVIPYVSYYGQENEYVKVSTKVNGAWVTETLDGIIESHLGLGTCLQFFCKKDANNNIVTKKLDLSYQHLHLGTTAVFFAERDLLNPSTWG